MPLIWASCKLNCCNPVTGLMLGCGPPDPGGPGCCEARGPPEAIGTRPDPPGGRPNGVDPPRPPGP